MKKLLTAVVLGAVVMVTGLGTQAASAATWGGYRGHAYPHPVYRTAFVRPHFYGRYNAPVYDRCW